MTELTKDELRYIKIVDSAEPGTIRGKLLELGWQQHGLNSATKDMTLLFDEVRHFTTKFHAKLQKDK